MKPAPKRPRTTQQAVVETQAALNRIQAVRLRVEGKTIREIAAALGVSHTTAHEYIRAELAEERTLGAQEREQLRGIERRRMEGILNRWYPIATAQNLDVSTEITTMSKDGTPQTKHIELPDFQAGLKAAETVIKVSARLSALDGLDAPTKQELSGTVHVDNVATIRARMAARDARRGSRI